jgi:hypothetical protein
MENFLKPLFTHQHFGVLRKNSKRIYLPEVALNLRSERKSMS